MTMDTKKLIRKQVSKRLDHLRGVVQETSGVGSWIAYIRKALGMSVRQLAERSVLSASFLSQLERREREGKITVQSLKQAAEALNCDFVYMMIPREPIEQQIEKQSRKKALEIINQSHLHMELEDQAVEDETAKQQVDDLAKSLEYSSKLWDK